MSSRITRNASAPAQGITQSNRWIGSAIGRADIYPSSVSFFFNSACGNLQRVVALRNAELAEVLAARAVGVHVMRVISAKIAFGAAGPVRIDCILREAGEVRRASCGMNRPGSCRRDAGDDIGIASLHGARRAAQRDDAARAAQRHVIEPARRHAEMLRQPDRGVRPQGEARYRETVDVLRPQACAR